jgi:hypothetical protein
MTHKAREGLTAAVPQPADDLDLAAARRLQLLRARAAEAALASPAPAGQVPAQVGGIDQAGAEALKGVSCESWRAVSQLP